MEKDYFSMVSGSFLSRSDIDPTTKIILINLNGRAGIPHWTCSPSNVANETGIGINTVSRRLRLLEELGVLSFDGWRQCGATRYRQYSICRKVLAAFMAKAAAVRVKAAGFNLKAAGVKLTARSNIQKEDPRSKIQKVDTSNQGIIKGTPKPEPHSLRWLELKKVKAERNNEIRRAEDILQEWEKEIGLSNYSENIAKRYSDEMSDAEIERFRDQ